jgi:hypothetical protein
VDPLAKILFVENSAIPSKKSVGWGRRVIGILYGAERIPREKLLVHPNTLGPFATLLAK